MANQQDFDHEKERKNKELALKKQDTLAMKMKEANSRPSRCLPNHLPKLVLCSLLLIVPLSVIIISAYISTPYMGFTSRNEEILVPSFIHSQIYEIQIQVGLLLKQLNDDSNRSNAAASKYVDQVLAIAVSLDKLAARLAFNDQNNMSSSNVMSEEYVEVGDGEDDEEVPAQTGQFSSGELQNYTLPKSNKHGMKNFLGVDAIYPSIGSSCPMVAADVNRFMTYKTFQTCPEDWIVAQKLIVAGCDPLPRRRCFTRSPPHYTKPLPVNSSLWSLPSDGSILWTHYKCKSFICLTSNDTVGKRGFFKCADCFDLSLRDWENASSDETISAEFSADEVLAFKPGGEIRIGLDFSPTTGTFAAIMKERNVTVASATLNLGAPFSEVIASRGLLPLYVSVGSRLPFFDNTLDMIHSTKFLDGWIGMELLQYVLFDWDRIIRPGGLLWIDRFFCSKEGMKLYLEEFEKLAYKKLRWRIVPKTDKAGDELFFSAVLEKPLRV